MAYIYAMSEGRKRTTIDLDISLYKRLKQHAVLTGKSMKDFISEAIEEKLDREIKHNTPSNPYASTILEHMERITSKTIARALLEEKCKNYGIHMEELNRHTFSDEMMEDILSSIALISPARNVEYLREKFIDIKRGE